ncbi:MAG: YeeE/YedE thiosulfate transporter family protein [Melioribacteraceae bacterium]|nr:YeeE/YedE thiosulfate transporter family protein [Melioribacteraceae bacterium]
MTSPFFKFGYFNDEVSLIVAFILGLAFGFLFERGGFGSGRMLAAQFYFTDMRVFKVMFTAITTAMIGLFYLSWIGFLDLSLVYFGETFLLPQVIGGLILGIGFVVGGYCPGTSSVAIATGKIDAIVYAFGGLFGIFVFGEAFPYITEFFYSTPMGQITLPELFGIDHGIILLAVIFLAIAGFTAADWGEKFMASKKEGK